MKGRTIVGSIVAILLIVFVPVTNAIQIQTVQKELSSSIISYDTLKNMNSDELVVFIQSLAQDYPQLSEEFQHAVDKMKNAPFSSLVTKRADGISVNKNQEPQSKSDNQTLLEKIFWKIYNYRVFRLLVSTLLFIYTQSKFTLWRTMTWGIRLLRWVKIGILLGFIDPNQQQPQTPNIVFQQDTTNKTVQVLSIDSNDVLWSDIDQIGAGSCDPLPVGNVTAGDILTNCTGIIVLQYIPTQEILGVFEFDQQRYIL
ncbi:MAG TPA: hypothetical protein VMY59_06895 [Candidatus Thermoplasmatota archaeon]|nr:hypothetical protein [Candidatus Thermoplasmatota archaeon]